MSRAFFFGCSYTGYVYPTWADFIGLNFNSYYNLGSGGACNEYIKNRVVEIQETIGFTKEDIVMVMFSGFTRFSYIKDLQWKHGGEIYNDRNFVHVSEDFIKKMWSDEWGIYRSWIAIKTVKQLLSSLNVRHVLMVSTDNSLFYDHPYGKDFKNSLTIYPSMMEWHNKKYSRKDYITWKTEGYTDSHPTPKMHYEFVKEFFPQYDTKEMYEFYLEIKKKLNTYSFQTCRDINWSPPNSKLYEIRNRLLF